MTGGRAAGNAMDHFYHLGREAAADGYRLEVFSTLGSTNDEAKSRIGIGDRGFLWVVAGSQNLGRGRMGRVWSSPPGNFYGSLLLIDPAPPQKLAELGFVAGVALADALRSFGGAADQIALKWPNDALANGAKLSGLLLEGVRLGDGAYACVIGVGVNCRSAPADTPYPATFLAALGVEAGPGKVLAALSDRFAHWLKIWRRGENFAAIRAAWLARAHGVGQKLRVSREGQIIEGRFQGIDASGRMLLERQDGKIETIEAGDVAFDPSRA